MNASRGLAGRPILGLAFTLAIVAVGYGQGTIVIREPVPHPRFPQRVTTTPLTVKYQRINVEITDGVAVTNVQQTFLNPLGTQVEGTYVFPLPDDVAVGDFSMTIDGKTLKGEVLEKDKARQTYEEIVRRTRDPGLLEFLGNRLYQASIFPIRPGGQLDVRIQYSAPLQEQGGLGSYQHPLRTQAQTAGTIDELSILVKLHSTQPLTSVFCPTHTCAISRPNDRDATVSFEQTHFRPERDFVLYYQRSDSQFGLSLLTHRQAGEDGYFLLRLSPRVELADAQIQPKDIAFVIDTSGSMNGEKLAQTKRALKFCINSLRAGDRFNIFGFSTDVRSFRESLVSVDDELKSAAVQYADKLEAVGGTNIHQALLAALAADPRDASRPYLIVFMTDGQPTVDVTDPNQILKSVAEKNAQRVRFHVFGVGTDVNTHLLDKLAEDTRGARDYCVEGEDLEIKLGGFVGRLSSPVLTDLKLALEGLGATDVYPQQLPDLFRGGDLVVMGRYRESGQRLVRLSGQLRGERKQLDFEGDFSAKQIGNDFLPRLWANRKVAFLLDEIRLRGSNKELVDEVVRLAKRFGIVTPYTSSLILEDDRPVAAGPPPIMPRRPGKAAPAGGRGGGGVIGGGGRFGGAEPASPAASGEAAVQLSRRLRDAKSKESIVPAESQDEEAGLQRRSVGDRTFVLEDGRYTDLSWDRKAKPERVVAFSDAYFELLRKHEALAKYLALGDRVLVVLDGKAYEIVPAEKP
ncbi:MAG: VWA domain-containing protein [Planctomycetes bacterium]|nr:VWA domain-containing protein [Planctomycetota bacterium]